MVYIPPNIPFSAFKCFLDNFSDLLLTLDGESFIFGDFNTNIVNKRQDVKSVALSNFLLCNTLSQHNAVRNKQGNILDLVLSHSPCEITLEPLNLLPIDTYHPPLKILLSYS